MSKKDTVIITGASGWMGEHAVAHAAEHFARVIMTDTGDSARWPVGTAGLFLRADLTKRETLVKIRERIRSDERVHIWHLGGVFDYAAPEEVLYGVNFHGTQHLVEEVALPLYRSTRLASFVYWSGTTVYGKFDFPPPATETSPRRPCNTYGWSKLKSEEYLIQMYMDRGLPIRIMEITGAYGPGIGQRKPYGMGLLFKLFHEGRLENMALSGSERCRASLVHVEDIMRVAHFLSYCEKAEGQRYIVTDDGTYTNVDISRTLGKLLDNPFIPGIRLPKAVLTYLITSIELTGKRYNIRPEVDSGLTEMMMLNTHASNAALWELAEAHGRGRQSADPLLKYPDSVIGLTGAIADLRREGWLA